MILSTKDQFKKLSETIKLEVIIEQFLEDFFRDFTNNTNSDNVYTNDGINIISNFKFTRKSQSSYFTVKSFKAIYSLIF